MHELEEGTKISILIDDDWVTGIFLGCEEEYGQNWIYLDIGRAKPRRINSGFCMEIEESPGADIIDMATRTKLNLVNVK